MTPNTLYAPCVGPPCSSTVPVLLPFDLKTLFIGEKHCNSCHSTHSYYRDVHWVGEGVSHQALDLAGHSGAEQQGLAVRANLAQDRPHLWCVKHGTWRAHLKITGWTSSARVRMGMKVHPEKQGAR
eukprot:1160202-Pelagomonas_calceolata.AAC.10